MPHEALAKRKAYMKLISLIYENHVLVTAKVAFKADCAAHCDTHWPFLGIIKEQSKVL